MKLSEILKNFEFKLYGSPDVEVTGITYDSREVKPGYIFIALSGLHTNGKNFITNAINAGAKVIVSDELITLSTVTLIVASNPLIAMAVLSGNFYHHPDKDLLLIGITGTNGKTTISYFLEAILKNQYSTGVIGTINYRYGNKVIPAANTTPQSADIYRILNEMKKESVKTTIMEVSSHALALNRVLGLEFDLSIFTNLTRDHLDFHNTMEDYFKAKSLLFTDLLRGEKKFKKFAIINIDDKWGRELTKIIKEVPVVNYGLDENAQVRARDIKMNRYGSEFVPLTPIGTNKIDLPHLGLHNIYNALACVSAAINIGIPLAKVIDCLEQKTLVPGRLEKIDSRQPYTVVVDFAHTDDALKNVIKALRDIKPNRIITVFGCGGDRDKTKRPIMGDAATGLSDFVFVTSDNPRSEDPERIAYDIEAGIKQKGRTNYKIIIDREEAIRSAISMAEKGDIILLAGKGHETYQIMKDKKIHFNDGEIAKKYLI